MSWARGRGDRVTQRDSHANSHLLLSLSSAVAGVVVNANWVQALDGALTLPARFGHHTGE